MVIPDADVLSLGESLMLGIFGLDSSLLKKEVLFLCDRLHDDPEPFCVELLTQLTQSSEQSQYQLLYRIAWL